GRPVFLRVEVRPFYRRLQGPPTGSVIDPRPGLTLRHFGEYALLASPSSMNPVLIYLLHAAIAVPNGRTMRWRLQRCWSFMRLHSIGFSYLRESSAPARPSV